MTKKSLIPARAQKGMDEDVVTEDEFKAVLADVSEWIVLKWKGVVVEEIEGLRD